MKVLLISANTEKMNMPVLPLGMACIAASTGKAGHTVHSIDLMMHQDIRRAIEEEIRTFSPEVIGVSVRNIDNQSMESAALLLDSVKTVISDCRDFSAAPVVLGGAGYSIFPKTVLEYLGADMGIQGEGEVAFVRLLERLEHKENVSGIPGLYLPGTVLPEKPCRICDLDEIPIPLPHIHLAVHSGAKEDELWIPFQTRRGCAMDCSYCSTATIEGRILRKFSPQKAVEGLRRYVEAGFHQFFFVDNTFNLPPSYAEALCDGIIAAGLNIRWRCILYPWKADDGLIEKMAKAGCREVSLGFESGSDIILKQLNKRFNCDDVVKVSQRLKEHGIARLGFLLLGGPGETMETVLQSLHFADALQLETLKISIGIRIYPCTALSRIAIQEGIVASEAELLFPRFYLADAVKTDIAKTVQDWMKDRPNWIR